MRTRRTSIAKVVLHLTHVPLRDLSNSPKDPSLNFRILRRKRGCNRHSSQRTKTRSCEPLPAEDCRLSSVHSSSRDGPRVESTDVPGFWGKDEAISWIHPTLESLGSVTYVGGRRSPSFSAIHVPPSRFTRKNYRYISVPLTCGVEDFLAPPGSGTLPIHPLLAIPTVPVSSSLVFPSLPRMGSGFLPSVPSLGSWTAQSLSLPLPLRLSQTLSQARADVSSRWREVVAPRVPYPRFEGGKQAPHRVHRTQGEGV